MFRSWGAVVAYLCLASACVSPNLVHCSDVDCPPGKVCDNQGGCALPDQLTACDGLPDNTPCSATGIPVGLCHLGVCEPAKCGDGILDGSEVCDDGNNASCDGCSADCMSNETCGNGYIDTCKGEQCDSGAANLDGTACEHDCTLPRCGNGILDPILNEACDLGAANSNAPDAECRSFCQLRRCGDGILDPMHGEECDDGNNISGDGCSGNCKREVCGNGIVDLGEECDAGPANSNAPNAACRTNCKRQKCGDTIIDNLFGELCDLGAMNSQSPNQVCRINCQPQRCGDAIVDNLKGEICDDGNNVSGDGCSGDCKSNETCGNGIVDTAVGEQCDAGGLNSNAPNAPCRTTCKLPRCGDGIVDNALGENCDAGAANSNAPNALCRPTCQPQRCGDGIVDNALGEVCDDGNNVSGDGCSADCKSNETCGNGYVDVVKGEQCDAGAANSNAPNSPCRTTCKVPFCGDGIVDNLRGEQCDVGAANSNAPNASCRTTCVAQHCGDGILDNLKGETCDDGNNVFGDGCSGDCKSNETCGNGYVDVFIGELCDDGNDRTHDGCSRCQPEVATVLVPNAAPAGRDMNGIAYDGARQRLVMFGGWTLNGNLNDTLEWDGTSWVQMRPQHSPKGLLAAAMAYDAVRHRIVLFGGYSANFGVVQNETWEYDGVDWTQRFPTTIPPARAEAAVAFDANLGHVVIYGGYDGTNPLGDMWQWTGANWVAVTLGTTNPGTRDGAVMAFDSKNTNVVLFGGGDAHTWTWSGAAWTDHGVAGATGPKNTGIDQDTMVYDASVQAIVLWDGTAGSTFTWSGSAWATVAATTPTTPRTRMQMGYDAIHKQIVMFGGCNGTLTTTCASGFGSGTPSDYADTWTRTGTAWAQPPAFVEPSPRQRAAATYDPLRRRVVLFGGQTGQRRIQTGASTQLGDTWEWDGHRWTQIAATTPPPPRGSHSLDYDTSAKAVRLYGGDNYTGGPPVVQNFFTDVWTYNGAGWTLAPSTGRQSVQVSTMSYDGNANKLVTFAGIQPVSPFANFNTTWLWDATGWHQASPATLPPVRRNAAQAYDPVRRRTVVFSGNPGNGTSLDDTWEWDGTNWATFAPPASPSQRNGSNLFFNSDASRVCLFGDSGQLSGEDLWEWSGTAWTQRAMQGSVTTKYKTAVAYDAANRELVAFSGRTSGASGTVTAGTVRLVYQPNLTAESCTSAQVDYNNNGKAGCADDDCWAVCNPLCPPGTTCPPSAPRCGDGTCNVFENCNICPADCGACAGTCGDFHCDTGETHASCPNDC